MCAGLGCPYCCLQRHAGARVVARDQSLLRVLAFDGSWVRAQQAKTKKASVQKHTRELSGLATLYRLL